MAEETLVDRWISKAKNRPVIAAICFLIIAISGLASFADSLGKIKAFFVGEASKPPLDVPRPQPQPQSQPAKRIIFREEFELGERGTFVSNHGVTVATKYIMTLEGRGVLAEVGTSAKGPIERFEQVQEGKQIPLLRADCDDLMVVVKDIQLYWPKEYTADQLSKMGPASERFVTRKVVGVVTGKCEE